MILPSAQDKAIFFIMMSIVLPKTISFPYPFCIENVTFHLWSIFFACAQLLKSLWCSMQFQCKCSSHLYRLNCRCSLQLYQTFCTPFSSWIQFCRVFSLSFFHYCTEKRSHRKDFLFYCRVYKSMLMHSRINFLPKRSSSGRQQKCIGKK